MPSRKPYRARITLVLDVHAHSVPDARKRVAMALVEAGFTSQSPQLIASQAQITLAGDSPNK